MEPYKKIAGCLLGGAAGDALGYPVEFLSAQQIFRQYGKDGVINFILRDGIAEISDDTQMTLYTANGLLFGKTRGMLRGIFGSYPEYIGRCYQDWMATQGQPTEHTCISWLNNVSSLYSCRAPGGTCLSALSQKQLGTISHPINNSKGCGGVMRVAPIALYLAGDQLSYEQIDRIGAETAALTHGHELGYIPAAMLVHIITYLLRKPDARLLTAVLDARNAMMAQFPHAVHLPELLNLIDRAIELAANDTDGLEAIDELGEGWVAEEALAIAVFCALRHENSFEQALILSVNHGGDSDSTGAITGNILGAYLGLDAISEKFLQNLELRDVITEIADDLARGCPVGEYSNNNDPEWIRKYVHAGRDPHAI